MGGKTVGEMVLEGGVTKVLSFLTKVKLPFVITKVKLLLVITKMTLSFVVANVNFAFVITKVKLSFLTTKNEGETTFRSHLCHVISFGCPGGGVRSFSKTPTSYYPLGIMTWPLSRYRALRI